MKKCYLCGYEGGKDSNLLCPICEGLLVFVHPEIRPVKKYLISSLIILIVCLLFFFILRQTKTVEITHKQKLPVYPYEDKIEKSIRALSGVIIPDYNEQEVVFAYLEYGSWRLKLASCETLIYWAAYSKTSRQLYLRKAAQPLYGDFEKKGELIDIFIYFLSMKTFLPQELSFMLPQVSSMACSKDHKIAQKALKLAFMIDENVNLCRS